MADHTAVLDTAPVIHGHPDTRHVGADTDEPGRRGSLLIKDKAVQRIAEAAALSVTGVVPADKSTNALNSALGRAYPRVDCDVAGGRVRAEVEIVGVWPTPAPLLAGQVRDAVTEELRQLAGLIVDAVDVTIAKIIRVQATPPRRVQ
ncbi:Asp23/Gls24 family envelope stress response protein [Paractinoplanes rishiriensis]|uniref:Asp23/Gls24 family envelope stress response protein n=1 Tax=Paractinoplanes rishiriensis TaxID=1050105 RepID=A0A919K9F5_9ACTN|nr:Asp23/Gls24 family envelope stress response protein [Actinoplanes rishiriensis]GIF01853.1 hypothetical protein Ari01nite_93170 [Actinoplanes rishiriensis]